MKVLFLTALVATGYSAICPAVAARAARGLASAAPFISNAAVTTAACTCGAATTATAFPLCAIGTWCVTDAATATKGYCQSAADYVKVTTAFASSANTVLGLCTSNTQCAAALATIKGTTGTNCGAAATLAANLAGTNGYLWCVARALRAITCGTAGAQQDACNPLKLNYANAIAATLAPTGSPTKSPTKAPVATPAGTGSAGVASAAAAIFATVATLL